MSKPLKTEFENSTFYNIALLKKNASFVSGTMNKHKITKLPKKIIAVWIKLLPLGLIAGFMISLVNSSGNMFGVMKVSLEFINWSCIIQHEAMCSKCFDVSCYSEICTRTCFVWILEVRAKLDLSHSVGGMTSAVLFFVGNAVDSRIHSRHTGPYWF